MFGEGLCGECQGNVGVKERVQGQGDGVGALGVCGMHEGGRAGCR